MSTDEAPVANVQQPEISVASTSHAISSNTLVEPAPVKSDAKPVGKKHEQSNREAIQLAPSSMQTIQDEIFLRPNFQEFPAFIDCVAGHYQSFLPRDQRATFTADMRLAFFNNFRSMLNEEHNKRGIGIKYTVPPKLMLPISVVRAIHVCSQFSLKDSSFPILCLDRLYALATLRQVLNVPNQQQVPERMRFIGRWNRAVQECIKHDKQGWVESMVRVPSLLTAGVTRDGNHYRVVNRTRLTRTEELLMSQLRLRLFNDGDGFYYPDVLASEMRALPQLICYWRSVGPVLRNEFVYQYVRAFSRRA